MVIKVSKETKKTIKDMSRFPTLYNESFFLVIRKAAKNMADAALFAYKEHRKKMNKLRGCGKSMSKRKEFFKEMREVLSKYNVTISTHQGGDDGTIFLCVDFDSDEIENEYYQTELDERVCGRLAGEIETPRFW